MFYIFANTIALLAYVLSRFFGEKRLLLVDGYMAGLFLYFMGILFFINDSGMSNDVEMVLQLTTLVILSSLLCVLFFMPLVFKHKKWPVVTSNLPSQRYRLLFGLIGIFIIFVNLFFVYKVLTTFSVVELLLMGDEVNLLDVRKGIASGEQGYFFPGLIKQIRDILAPVLIGYLLFFMPKNQFFLLKTLLIGTTIGAMLIGGQRFPFIVLIGVLYLLSSYRDSMQDIQKNTFFKKVLLILLMFVLLFIITVILGRAEYSGNVFTLIGDLVYSVFDRIFFTVARENILAFPFMSNIDFGFASLWVADLSILLPGLQGSITNEIHHYLGGSQQGNSVTGLPLDIYFNAGYFGLIIVPFLVVWFISVLDNIILAMDNGFLFSTRFVILLYVPMMYSPYQFLLNGGLFLLFVIGLILMYRIVLSRYRTRDG